MPSTSIELMMSKGFRHPNLGKATGPSIQQGYWDVLGYWLQPYVGRHACSWFNATTSTGFSNINAGGTTAGTISTPTLANTNILTQCRRTVSTSTAATSSSASVYSVLPFFFVSSTARIGGFVHCYRVAFSTTVVGNRAFIGVSNVGDPVASANLGNSGYYYGFGFDTGDAVANGFYFMCNNNSTRTKTQVSNMSRTASTVLEIWIWNWPQDNRVYAWVWDLTNDAEDYPVTAVSSNVPLDTALYSSISLNTGISSSAVVANWIRWECFCPW
jgi:hypothetical protein